MAMHSLRRIHRKTTNRYHQRRNIYPLRPTLHHHNPTDTNSHTSSRQPLHDKKTIYLVLAYRCTRPHNRTPGRIYDQIFLDGTYTAGGCLIVAANIDHVIAWHWCKHETTYDYQLLIQCIQAPLITVIDGG